MKQTYYSHGKLLLTGEYFVLDGVQALAVPCKFGQSLEVSPSQVSGVSWVSYAIDGECWFTHHFSFEEIREIPVSKPKSVADRLQKILHFAYQEQPLFFEDLAVYCETKLEFPRDWGLGTSSTLIYNIALWTGVDAYKLLETSFGGSGYDIAAAESKKPFLYQRYATPRLEEINLAWKFTDQLFFVHRNQKQDSKEGIARYRDKVEENKEILTVLNSLTQDFIQAENIEQLGDAIERHESLVAEFIELPTIKESLFPDYPYAIKSLGAWGGDFFLAIGSEEDKTYFKDRGYATILSFKDMVLDEK